MTNKNFDGIKKQKMHRLPPKVLVRLPAAVSMDAISNKPAHRKINLREFHPVKIVHHRKLPLARKPETRSIAAIQKAVTKHLQGIFDSAVPFVKNLYIQRRVPVLAAVFALLLAFGGGMVAALGTSSSRAYDPPSATSTPPGAVILPGAEINAQNGTAVDNQVLFNTPIESLKNYFDSINQPDIINNRKIELTQFLKDMHSPLVPAAETIAEQPHWQLILAIAFAESTLGKNCNDFNCSNIGVGPDSPSWRKYDSYDAWVVDFNRLLDKKYNNWTLEQMCGVYVKPCSDNWLSATQEILDALNERGIQ